MTQSIHTTKDGSSTLYSQEYDQYYHNPNGAASESLYVFFERSGLFDELENRDEVTILEIGFGTGLNLLLLADHLAKNKLDTHVKFYSVEAFPITPQVAGKLEIGAHISNPEFIASLSEIFSSLNPGMNRFNPFEDLNIDLNLFKGFFNDFSENVLSTDYIFHDAFSPEVNEELWTDSVFRKLADLSHSETLLTTYCAASKARAAMCAAGWYVAKTRGALGKREMTIASRSEDKLSNFKRVNEQRLADRYQKGDFD